MGIATTPTVNNPSVLSSQSSKKSPTQKQPSSLSDHPLVSSMSQDHFHHHHHQGFFDKPPLVSIGEEEEPGGISGYEPSSSAAAAGMLSEMFGFPSTATVASAPSELLLHQHMPPSDNFRSRPLPGSMNTAVTADPTTSAAAMQLFLMNPHHRSPSPPPSAAANNHNNNDAGNSHSNSNNHNSSTLHMLLPNPSHGAFVNTTYGGGGGGSSNNNNSNHTSLLQQHQPQLITWTPDHHPHHHHHHHHNQQATACSGDIGAVRLEGGAAGQGLSLSLSSSLKADQELRNIYYNAGGTSYSTNPSHQYSNYQFKNMNMGAASSSHISHHNHNPALMHLQGGQFGSASSFGAINVLRSSKYAKPAQELLEEFCSVGRGQFKKSKLGNNSRSQNNNNNTSSNPTSSGGGGAAGSSSSTKDNPPLSASDRIEHQRRKVKLLSMLDEVDRRYNHYCEQMQMVVNSFDLVMGFGAAVPYTALAQKAMSRHFRCLKDAISAQLKHSCELLGEKDATGSSGITKGETPRLRLLEQSLRHQRAFHQMGMMEQEAWRPQRGLPERSVNVLRAWLFEHFLHPYPSDADKHLLARQTGLSRNQVSNWFINARVRLWKPMVEEMYQQELKEGAEGNQEPKAGTTTDDDNNNNHSNNSANSNDVNNNGSILAQVARSSGHRSEVNATEGSHPSALLLSGAMGPAASEAVQPVPQPPSFEGGVLDPDGMISGGDMCRLENYSADMAPAGAVMRYGTAAATATGGDVSLTLGLRHAGNLQDQKNASFSVRDFGGY